MAHLTEPVAGGKPPPPAKPAKPFPTFPLTPHASGKWMKKINGRIHYFGNWARVKDGVLTLEPNGGGWADALKLYEGQATALHGGQVPRRHPVAATADHQPAGLTVADLCNHFLTDREARLEAGEIGPRMFADYKAVTDELVTRFGKTRPVADLTPQDFGGLRAAMAKKWGPVRLSNFITRARTVFKFGKDNDLLPAEVRYGTQFGKPAKAVLRKHKAKAGVKLMEPADLRKLLDAADPVMRAMILLGLNCGYGNTDIATLPRTAVDLDGGWIDYPRPKTGVARRAKLWPETVEAMRAALKLRPSPKDPADAGLVFLTARGGRWVRPAKKSFYQGVSVAFARLAKTHGVHNEGANFYTLRRCFRTVADEACDAVATDYIMGHNDPSMGATYRQKIADTRLEAVAVLVRAWLFAEPKTEQPAAAEGGAK